ncbi:hypothetical protein [Phycicoccus sp. Root101]|uniref:hypothetical protein n=1 Tax=Phycicoccus sp. Root101 TaxID=1736421 RepID=UPI000702C04E|nr:hypothetical protein [Phycicoccus sp. Root101]KQU68494.1 hypothetical protein ASC58_07110 [Phycicoccus sp. Root101]
MSSRRQVAGLVALVLALLVTGAVLWIGGAETEFGWFAYSPLDQQPSPGIFLISERRQAALVVSLVGLLLLSGVLGFVVGRRATHGSEA